MTLLRPWVWSSIRPSQNGSQPELDSRIARRSLGKRSNMPVKIKWPERRHIVAGKTQGVIQPAQRQLHIFSPLAFELAKRLKAALAILAMSGDRKIELGSQVAISASYSGSWSHFPAGRNGFRTETAPSSTTARRASFTISPTSEPGNTATNLRRLGSRCNNHGTNCCKPGTSRRRVRRL